MNLKSYLFAIFVGILVALGIWLLIFFNIDPFKADFITIGAFFASLFLWLWGLLALLGFYLKVWLGNKEVIYANLPIALRQTALISLIIVGLLIFQTLRVLTWWVGGILVLVILLLELFFRARAT